MSTDPAGDEREAAKHRVYVASSWRNDYQQRVVAKLREYGHEVYDFRNLREGDHGFHWSEIDPNWLKWTPEKYIAALDHPVAQSGFKSDWNAMEWADCCVLVLPCGRSAHLEAGYFVGAGKPIFVYVAQLPEPELMYKMTDLVTKDLFEILSALQRPFRARVEAPLRAEVERLKTTLAEEKDWRDALIEGQESGMKAAAVTLQVALKGTLLGVEGKMERALECLEKHLHRPTDCESRVEFRAMRAKLAAADKALERLHAVGLSALMELERVNTFKDGMPLVSHNLRNNLAIALGDALAAPRKDV